MPTQTSSVRVTGKATLPIEFDYGPVQGDPDLLSSPGRGAGRTAGSYTPAGGMVSVGNWVAGPGEIGPYPKGAAGGEVDDEDDRDDPGLRPDDDVRTR